MRDPQAVFASPEAVEESTVLTAAQKLAVLAQWKNQLIQLLRADSEGMVRSDPAATPKLGANAECLRRVTDIMARLSE